MLSRRQFIQRGVAASALAACPRAASALAVLDASRSDLPGEPHPFFKVLFDRTTAEGTAFGAEAARRGAAVCAVGADLGGVWLHDIEPRWKRGAAAIAGLTSGPHLFCLELLARDYGLAVVYRARHERASGGQFGHAVAGPEALCGQARERLGATGRSWAKAAVDVAMTCPVAFHPDPRLGLVDLADGSRTAERPLYSWVIAPNNRARGLAVQL